MMTAKRPTNITTACMTSVQMTAFRPPSIKNKYIYIYMRFFEFIPQKNKKYKRHQSKKQKAKCSNQ
jgi:hypothetical protein